MATLIPKKHSEESFEDAVPAEVSTEPVLVPKISYWDRVAKQYGFTDSNAVRTWQVQNGLVADGKFGNNSKAVWNQFNGVSATPYWDAVARANGFENAAAVATWQAQHGLVADGKIGTKTLAALQLQNINNSPRLGSWQK
jgi:peptidoglycan hydrolase-like protein with peptidoglycan-binding domain